LVSFDPSFGHEIKKTRPAVIVQNDISNRYSSTTLVAPLTSYKGGRIYPTEVLVQSSEGGLDIDSIVTLEQIRAIDKRRLVSRLGIFTTKTMASIDKALLVSLGLVDF